MSTNQSAEIEKCEECGKSHFMVGDDPHDRTRHYPYIPNPKRRQRDELDEILTLINYGKIKTKDAKARIQALSESRAIEELENHKKLLLTNIVIYKNKTVSEMLALLEARIKELKERI